MNEPEIHTLKISVVIPVHNEEKNLAECLNSLIHQTYRNYEIIIVNNDSTDGTATVIEDFQKKSSRVKTVFEERRGRGSARNAGVRAASGDIIAMTDADCTVPPTWLADITAPIIKDGEQAVVGWQENTAGTQGNYWSRATQKADLAFCRLRTSNGYISQVDTKNFAIRAEILKKYGFNGTLRAFEDLELFVRLGGSVKIRFLPNVIVRHRHPKSMEEVFRTHRERASALRVIRKIHPEIKPNHEISPSLSLPYAAVSFAARVAARFSEKKSEDESSSIQMEPQERAAILKVLQPPAHFLVFGLGNDSALWANANHGGQTIFIEDDPTWFKTITTLHPYLTAYLVTYNTTREQWKELLEKSKNKPQILALELPPAITKQTWDVILVDGPAGYADGTAGRMKSIYASSKLIRPGSDVFIHDAEREIENAYANTFLLEKNIVGETSGRAILRHYHC